MLVRVSRQTALILHRRPYRNTSFLLEAFSEDYGRISLVARGTGQRYSPWPAILQPFTVLTLSWSGNGDMCTLTAAEELAPRLEFRSTRIYSGFYVNELLMYLLHRNDPHPELFAAYRQVLQALLQTDDEEAALRLFEKRLLAQLGYGLRLDSDVDGAALDAKCTYRYVLEQGPVAAATGGQGIEITGSSLLAFQREKLADERSKREVKRLMRAAIAFYLDGRPLQSRRLLEIARAQKSSLS